MNRIVTDIKEADSGDITSTYIHGADSSGRNTTITVTSGSLGLTTVSRYDLAGRLYSTTDKKGLLVRNMFCEVEFSGRPLSEKIVIPRSAMHDGQVYVVDNENRLLRRAVTVDFTQSDFGVIRQGLSAGEQVVVSDVMPAIDGMLLSTTEDEALYNRLVAQAGGLTDIR